MSIQLGVYLGPAFADYCLIDTTQPNRSLGYKRCYTPSEGIAGSLKQFLQEQKHTPPERLIVASHLLEKIFNTKLGGSVAQIVTRGFEHWTLLRQSLQSQQFELLPLRTEPLASQDLIFGINERINSAGEIICSVDIKELEFIASKLKMMNIERVCVNLLFANKNAKHLQQVSKFFLEQSFEVYFQNESINTSDEIISWRKNLLNASLAGTFNEIKKDLLSAVTEGTIAENIFFLDGSGKIFQSENSCISSSLFGPKMALQNFYKNDPQALVLGMEKWFLLFPDQKQNNWQSPWGSIAGNIPKFCNLNIQPTQEILSEEEKGFKFGPEDLGYEPGPMYLGRAFKPVLFDAIQILNPMEEFKPFASPTGLTKLRDSLKAMQKNTSVKSKHHSPEEICQDLVESTVDQIALQVLLSKIQLNKELTLTGVFAPFFLPYFKGRWPEIKLKLCPYAREVEAMSVAAFKENKK